MGYFGKSAELARQEREIHEIQNLTAHHSHEIWKCGKHRVSHSALG